MGANPNARSTFEQGLRMHPLSWNVYGGHIENIRLLLKHGADVNLDFDSMGQPPEPVNALDVLLELQRAEQGDQRFMKMEKLLRDYGAMTVKEMIREMDASGDEL
jgi:ankyrin repeat protein